MTELPKRMGLPDALRVLVEELPRSGWETHENFNDFIRFWLDRHLMFRDVLGRMQQDVEAALDKAMDPVQYAANTQRYGGFLLNQLHTHHQVEDHHYFPQLQNLDSRISRGFDLLDSDHHALDGRIHAMAATLSAFLRAEPDTAAQDAMAEVRVALTGFAGLLDRHLLDEEDLVVPVILKYAPNLH